MRTAAATAILSVLIASWAAPASAPGDVLGYCNPSASRYDPLDVPVNGSAPVSVPGVRERRIVVDGLGTRLLEAGRPHSRVAVVFVHGSPGSGADWADLMAPVVADRGRAIAIDMPGFGHADYVWNAPPTLDAAARFLDSALEKLGIRRVHLVAHDVGGPVGLEWAARHPRRLRSVVLIDTGLLLGYRHHSLARISRTPNEGEAFWLALNRVSFFAGIQFGQSLRRPLPFGFVSRLYDDLDRETRCAIIRMYRSADEPEIHRFARRQAAVLRRTSRPALVLWGARDPYLPVEMAHRQRRGFPDARVVVFRESGHWPFVDDASRAGRLVVPFLRDVLGGAGEG